MSRKSPYSMYIFTSMFAWKIIHLAKSDFYHIQIWKSEKNRIIIYTKLGFSISGNFFEMIQRFLFSSY